MSREDPVNQSVEMERAVLGAIVVSKGALAEVVETVKLLPGDFGFAGHRLIYEAALELAQDEKPVDELSVVELLERRDQVKDAGGREFVASLASSVPAAGNAKHYAERVVALADARHTREVGLEVAAGLTPAAAIERLQQIESRAQGPQIATICGADVRLRVPKFLDAAEMTPTRSVTVVFGPAGLGKTVYSLGQCAAVTKGSMTGLTGPAPVLISSLEDDPEAVLAPRLVAAGADMSLVHFVSGLSLPSQVPALSARAKALGVALVLIDPVAAHLDPEIDSHRDASVRAALAPLAEAAQELEVAALIVAHPNKATSATGLNRISGSGAFGNAARSVIVFGLDPGDPDGETGSRRLIGHMKCNVGRRAPTISAELETTIVKTEDGDAEVPRLRITGLSDHSADDVLASPTGEERTERDDAREFLQEQLAGGPVRSKELKSSAEQNGLNWRTVERAKRDLEIKAQQTADGWYWLPPGQADLEGSS